MPRTLRGKIVESYGSMRAFADALGWNGQKVLRIVGGSQEPTASEILAMASLLHVDVPEDLMSLFFQSSPQNVDI